METTDDTIDVEALICEIERYLAVVEVFRAAGCDVGGLRRRLAGTVTARQRLSRS